MNQKRKSIFVYGAVVIALLACQSINAPLASPEIVATQTGLGEIHEPPSTSTEEGLFSKFPADFLSDPDTACIVNGYQALSCLDANGWHVYEDDAFESTYLPGAMAKCPDGRTYVVQEDEVYKFDGETLVNIGRAFSAENITCGRDGEIWTGHWDGVSHFDGSTWTHYPATEYFGADPGEFVTSLAIAPNGNVWVSTQNNIAVFDGASWKIVTRPGQEFHKGYLDCRCGLVVGANGMVWVPTDTELLKYDGVQWSAFSEPEESIIFITLDNQNRVWAATWENRIYMFDEQTNQWSRQFETREFGVGELWGNVQAMQFDRQDRLWVATDYGLDIYDGSNWTTYQMHTADLYANDVDDIFIFGSGPQLPALVRKAPGSVRGKVIAQDATVYADAQAEICVKPITWQYGRDLRDDTPCSTQAYHALTSINSDGYFGFTDVPVGRYYLVIKISSFWYGWGRLDPAAFYIIFEEFEVKPGEETQLGEIVPEP